jgi:hypothetical protein
VLLNDLHHVATRISSPILYPARGSVSHERVRQTVKWTPRPWRGSTPGSIRRVEPATTTLIAERRACGRAVPHMVAGMNSSRSLVRSAVRV